MSEYRYEYALYDGELWTYFCNSVDHMPLDEIVRRAEQIVADWDYGNVAQAVAIYEFGLDTKGNQDGSQELIGHVVVPGRMYQCPTCHGIYPHPPQELAVCRCGHVGSAADLIEEDYT